MRGKNIFLFSSFIFHPNINFKKQQISFTVGTVFYHRNFRGRNFVVGVIFPFNQNGILVGSHIKRGYDIFVESHFEWREF